MAKRSDGPPPLETEQKEFITPEQRQILNLVDSIPLQELETFIEKREREIERMGQADQPDNPLVQQILSLEERRSELIEQLVNENRPFIRGSFNKKTHKCGKKNCKCTRGEFHKSFQLSARVDGRTHTRHIPKSDSPRVERDTKRYQAWISSRAEIVRFCTEQLQLIDKRRSELLRSYPEGQPFPLPKSWEQNS